MGLRNVFQILFTMNPILLCDRGSMPTSRASESRRVSLLVHPDNTLSFMSFSSKIVTFGGIHLFQFVNELTQALSRDQFSIHQTSSAKGKWFIDKN